MNSEIAQCEAATTAIQKEIEHMSKARVYVRDDAREWAQVWREEPDAEVMWGHMLLGIKGSELDVGLQKWKEGFVGWGNRVFDKFCNLCHEKDLFINMANLTAVRMCLYHAMVTRGICLRSDAASAYTQAKLTGPPNIFNCLNSMWPKWWDKLNEPVVRLRTVLCVA